VALLAQFQPDEIYTVSDIDAHEDHRAVALFIRAALDARRAAGALVHLALFETIVWYPGTDWSDTSWPNVSGFTPTLPFYRPATVPQARWDERVSFLVPPEMQFTDPNQNLKLLAIRAYPSQYFAGDPTSPTDWMASFVRLDEFYWLTTY